MKNLIIIRHAKTEQGFIRDFDRKLLERGHSNAVMMAERLLQQGYKIDKIFSSPAVRAAETTEHFALVHNVSSENIKFFEKLYLGGVLEIIETVSWLKENIQTLAVVAHNPGVTNYTNDVTGSDIESLPTCGIAIVELEMDDWENSKDAPKKLVKLLTPKGQG